MRNLKRVQPDIIHDFVCRCDLCTPRIGPAERAVAMLALGMVVAVLLLAIDGQLGAALRALFGL